MMRVNIHVSFYTAFGTLFSSYLDLLFSLLFPPCAAEHITQTLSFECSIFSRNIVGMPSCRMSMCFYTYSIHLYNISVFYASAALLG